MTRCHRCGGDADALRANARIIDGVVVAVCRACAGAPVRSSEPAATLAWCDSCGEGVPVTRAVPSVRDGQIVQRCPDCAAGRAPAVREVVVEPPLGREVPKRHGRARLAAFAAALVACVAAPSMSVQSSPRPLDLDLDDADRVVSMRNHRARVAVRDEPLRFQAYMASDPRPVNWHHPLAGDRRLPRSPSRRFKAKRPRAEKRPECGGGHCGVDLGHLRGEVVHAAGDGIVDRIVRSDEDIAGIYVRIRHPQGYTTFYMHLGRIHPELEVGQEISAGDPIANIGLSGITYSAPHLHFAIRETRDDGSEIFVDPEPFLRKATVRASEAPFPGRDQI